MKTNKDEAFSPSFYVDIINETEPSLPFSIEQATKIAEFLFQNEQKESAFVEVLAVNETRIVEFNQTYLDRDYITDIISFQTQGPDEPIEGSLVVCTPRIIEQAQEFGTSTEEECLRVYIHGLLHLCGYNDQTEEDKERMTQKEDFYLTHV